jgi:hypothetical protein
MQVARMHDCPVPHATPQAPQFAGSIARLTQAIPHKVSFAPHIPPPLEELLVVPLLDPLPPPLLLLEEVGKHVSRTQDWLGSHATPQPPQFAGSMVVSTQAPLQSVRLEPHPLEPLEEPLLEELPLEEPLLEELLIAPLLEPLPPLLLLEDVGKHVSRTQDSLGAHAIPQPPQFAGSMVVSMQAPLQSVRLGLQPPEPLEEPDPPPLLDPLLLPPEVVGGRHVARAHESPRAHATPQAPQLFGSESVEVQRLPQTTRPVLHVPSVLGGCPAPP